MSDLVSVVICTYNRGDLIQGCLDSLKDQTADPSTFEVIVVDNNSSDNTLKVLENYTRLSNLRIFFEEKQGLSHARNRGLIEAKGKYIAYLDDDARAECHYVENILKLLEQFEDRVDCYGGPILPFYTTPKPAWFKDEYEARRQNWEAGILRKGQTFSGSNMIWKKSTLIGLEGFDTSYGMKGNQLLGGEETSLFDHLWDQGNPKLYYSPELIVFHWVPGFKMGIGYRLKRIFSNGLTLGRIETDNQSLSFKINYFMKHSIWSAINTGRAILHLSRHEKFQNWIIEEVGLMMIELGKVLVVIGIDPKLEQQSR